MQEATVPSPVNERPIIVVRTCHNPMPGGHAAYLTTALGSRLHLAAFHPDGRVQTVTTVVRGCGW